MTVLDRSAATLSVVNQATIGDLARTPLPTNLVAGDQLYFDLFGQFFNNSGSACNLVMTFGIGATTVANAAISQAASGQMRSWRCQIRIAVESPTAQRVWGEFSIGAGTAAGVWSGPAVIGNLLGKTVEMAEDLTAGKDVFLRCTLGAADANLRMDRLTYLLWKL